MWIISKSRLREFWEFPGREDSQAPLRAWHTVASRAQWQSFADLKLTYGNASLVGDCIVFNIAGNKYRLVVRVRFLQHKIFVLKLMTHQEYDEDTWKESCGCYRKPPQSGKTANEIRRRDSRIKKKKRS